MNMAFGRHSFLFCLVFLLLLSSCATLPVHPPKGAAVAYTVAPGDDLLSRHAPVFIIENPASSYNRIGTPAASLAATEKERVFVDSGKPTIYTRMQRSDTETDSYTHLYCRVHFEKVPVKIVPFHIGAGNNVGLIVVVSLNGEGVPILYTTVHTCGCYLAFIPTTGLSREAYPENWIKTRRSVYSESLPGLLDFGNGRPDRPNTLVLIRDGSHRVKDIWLADRELLGQYRLVEAELKEVDTLESLPLKGGEGITSFFESTGSRKGYVKASYKLFERLFMSWWALDWRVGEDKKLGRDKSDGPVFYTSLKPWNRESSDMRDFSSFLKFWGWRL